MNELQPSLSLMKHWLPSVKENKQMLLWLQWKKVKVSILKNVNGLINVTIIKNQYNYENRTDTKPYNIDNIED